MTGIYPLLWTIAAGLAAALMEARTAPNYKRKLQPFNILLPYLLAAILPVRYAETPLTIVKGVFLLLTLYYAAMQDIRTREVDDCASVMIALIQFDTRQSLQLLFGVFVTAFPLFSAAMIKPGRIGGADIKIMAAVGCLLGAEKGILALVIGLLLAVICVSAYRKIKKTKTNAAFALVPFLAAGSYAVFLF